MFGRDPEKLCAADREYLRELRDRTDSHGFLESLGLDRRKVGRAYTADLRYTGQRVIRREAMLTKNSCNQPEESMFPLFTESPRRGLLGNPYAVG